MADHRIDVFLFDVTDERRDEIANKIADLLRDEQLANDVDDEDAPMRSILASRQLYLEEPPEDFFNAELGLAEMIVIPNSNPAPES